MRAINNIAVYEWQAWELFLVSHLIDPACRVSAGYEDAPDVLGPAIDAGAEAVLLHIDVTRCAAFPRRRAGMLDYCRGRGVPVLNAGIGDIGKRTLQGMLENAGLPSARAAREGDPDEWLFLKSNLNAGGQSEARHAVTRHTLFGFSQDAPIKRADQYYRAQRKSVDPALWQNPCVAIERHIDNPEHSFYRMYRFGEAIVVVKGHSKSLIKKLCGHWDDRNYPATYQELIAGRTNLPGRLNRVLAGFLQHCDVAYCCVDVAHDQGDYYIIDLNLTPYSGTTDENPDMVAFLQDGAARHVQALRSQPVPGAVA